MRSLLAPRSFRVAQETKWRGGGYGAPTAWLEERALAAQVLGDPERKGSVGGADRR
jgi:hypothetical protein